MLRNLLLFLCLFSLSSCALRMDIVVEFPADEHRGETGIEVEDSRPQKEIHVAHYNPGKPLFLTSKPPISQVLQGHISRTVSKKTAHRITVSIREIDYEARNRFGSGWAKLRLVVSATVEADGHQSTTLIHATAFEPELEASHGGFGGIRADQVFIDFFGRVATDVSKQISEFYEQSIAHGP